MPSIRKRVVGFIRQLSHSHQSSSQDHHDGAPKSSGCFIQRYLSGDEHRQQQPAIVHTSGNNGRELPVRHLGHVSPVVFAAYTGPEGGLTTVNRSQRHVSTNDPDVDFIDEQSSSQSSRRSSVDSSPDALATCRHIEIAGVVDWCRPHPRAYGAATTLYERHPVTRQNAGNPIADAFAIVARENSAVLALADGVNWGEKASLAARSAIHGAVDYLNKVIFGTGNKAPATPRPMNTPDVFVALLRSFHMAHSLILQEGGMLTTLTAAVVLPLQEDDQYVVCVCNVGDSLAYVYSPQHGVREITQGSHDIHSMRDMRDALGALGPVDGQNPELNNLTCSMTEVQTGDIVFLTSDGISDNFDPVVGKFAVPKKNSMTSPLPSGGRKSRSGVPASASAGSVLDGGGSDDLSVVLRRSLPLVEAHQRHELTLMRLEDLLAHGVSGKDPPCHTAQELCLQLVDFATKLTVAKRRILEDPELYISDSDGKVTELSRSEQRCRRRKVCERLAMVPGKLDHATVVAYTVGEFIVHPSPTRLLETGL